MSRRGGFPGGMGGGNMNAMLKQAQKMQAELAKAQDEIKEMSFTGTSGGGMVKVTALGDQTIDMVCAAVNEALRGIQELSNQRMSSVTGGMNIPGLM